MPTMLDLRALALEMKAAQDTAHQVEPFTTRLPTFDLSAAYEVAHLIHHARVAEGAKPIGRKIGFTNSDMWDKFAVREPIWSYVYDTTVVYLSGTQATCPMRKFVEPKIEPEIVFRFRAAPRAGARLVDLLHTVDWVAHGFEIVQSHFPRWKFQAPDTVADSGLHGTLLIGPPQPLPQLGDDVIAALESFTLNLSCNDRQVQKGRGSNVLGNPLAAIVHLLSILARQPKYAPLQSGEIVTTGTITVAQPIQEGETWRSEVEGISLPGLTVTFSA